MPDAPTTPDPLSPKELLERESAGRQRAGIAALLAALFLTAAFLIEQKLRNGSPGVLITDALRDATGQNKSGLLTKNVIYLHDKVVLTALQPAFQILGWIGFVILLLFLFDAAKGRRPAVPAWTRSLLLAATVAAIVGTILTWIGQTTSVHDFVNSTNHSSQAARDALNPSLSQLGRPLTFFGVIGIIVAWVIVSLNGMRVGLLTRFLGPLGILGAIFTVFLPPIIQIFWLFAVGLTVLGKSPSGIPPAWQSGKPEPWPTKQEAREQREREKAGTSTDSGEGDAPSPATSARKRKRRG